MSTREIGESYSEFQRKLPKKVADLTAEFNLKDYKRERLELQTKAITYCDELLFYIELSYELNIINSGSMEAWPKMVTDIKHMAIAWRTKDRNR